MLSSQAAAQTSPPRPPSPPSREQVEPPPSPKPESERRQVRIDSSKALEPEPCKLDDSPIRMAITGLRFTGYGGAALAPEISELLAAIPAPGGEPREISVVCRIRDEANARLSQAGYVARVQIPPQRIGTGELRLEVVTARIVAVRIKGDAPPYRRTIAARVAQLKALDPVNVRDLERILLIAGDVPGLDVQLALHSSGNVGEVIGELAIAYRPYSIVANVNNLGSRQLGRESVYVRGELYGLTGLSDVTYIGASSTFDFEEQRVLQAGHAMGIGNGGLTIEGSFLYAWSRPDVGLLDLRSESLVAGLVVTAPLRRTRRGNIQLAGGFELIEQRTRIFNGSAGIPLNRDKLRVAFLGLEASFRDFLSTGGEAYSVRAALEVRKGVDILNATERREISPSGFTPSRFDGDPTALVVRGDVDAVVGIGPIFSLAGRARAQWSDHALLNFEEFSLGNLTIGRGYDPGANSADRAVGLRAEARAKVHDDGRRRLETFAFYDSVWIWNLDPNAIETDRRLGSWGGGVRALLAGIGLLEATYARPEHRALLVPGATRSPDRLLLSLTVQFPAGGR
jgi:hemolysin activation/secretion protein